MIWNWFKKKEVKELYVRNYEEQIRDIRRRIEEQRALLEHTSPRPDTPLETSPVLEETRPIEHKPDRKELDDIKAKLMRRKT